MRLKIKITIQKEVMNGAILQQVDTLGPTNTQIPYIHMHTCILYIHKHSSVAVTAILCIVCTFTRPQ